MKRILVSLLLLAGVCCSVSAQSFTRAKQFNLEKGVAIQGYDPVAYFTQNKAVKGSKDFAASADGVTYLFSNLANKNLFVKDYKKYEPQYGGWCAYAMGAANEKVPVDPATFKVVNGKLFLFYHSWTNNTLTKWNKDEANLTTKADRNWMAFVR